MPTPNRSVSPARSVQILRLLAALGVLTALAAIVAVVKGDSANRGETLVVAAVMLCGTALIGMGLSAWPYLKKAKNDPRP